MCIKYQCQNMIVTENANVALYEFQVMYRSQNSRMRVWMNNLSYIKQLIRLQFALSFTYKVGLLELTKDS